MNKINAYQIYSLKSISQLYTYGFKGEKEWYEWLKAWKKQIEEPVQVSGDKSPYRMKMRPMGLSLTGALDPMLRGQKIADLITTTMPPGNGMAECWSGVCVSNHWY